MVYETLPVKPELGQGWAAWGSAADANLRQAVADLTTLPDLTAIYDTAKT